MIRRILSWHRDREARKHAPIVPEPDFRMEVLAMMKQQNGDIRALAVSNRKLTQRVQSLERRMDLDDAILSGEFAGLDQVMGQSASDKSSQDGGAQ